jgi:RNA:NAD 2'-phosphotransferase (TPT1/KptA family)
MSKLSFCGNQNPLVILSKKLSLVLRHQAIAMGFSLGTDGYILISEILQHEEFLGYTREDISAVVDGNDKRRFEIKLVNGNEMIRASQAITKW